MISIVIPTLNEANTIEETIRRTTAALDQLGGKFELIVVDDASSDGTAERVEGLTSELPVRILRRVGKRGLATAVVDGWAMAEGDVLGVMDADLEHPPEVLAELAAALDRSRSDLALASRYAGLSGSRGQSIIQRVMSWGAAHLAATVLPLKLRDVTDPMSGMFVVRAKAVQGINLAPTGYKILLEVLGKGRIRKTVEVPYQADERAHRGSKLGVRQYAQYLAHLLRLARSTGQLHAWLRYTLVELTGAALEFLSMFIAVSLWGWQPLGALAFAIELAIVWNFLGNSLLTFSPQTIQSNHPETRLRHNDGTRLDSARYGGFHRLARYEWVCMPGAVANGAVTLLLLAHHYPLVLAVGAGIVADGALNTIFNIPSIWRVWAPQGRPILPFQSSHL